MKDTRTLLREQFQETTQIHKQAEIRKTQKLLAQIIPCRGHKFFQLNKETREIREAEFEDVIIDYTKPDKVQKKVIVKEGHLYTTALNKKNAEKHFVKMILREKGYTN